MASLPPMKSQLEFIIQIITRSHSLFKNSRFYSRLFFQWFLSLPIQAFCGLRNYFCCCCLSIILCCSLVALGILFCFHKGGFIWIRCVFCSNNFFYMWLNKIWFRRSNEMLSNIALCRVRFCFHFGYDLIMFFSSFHTHIKSFCITNNTTAFYRAKSKPQSLWSLIKKPKE